MRYLLFYFLIISIFSGMGFAQESEKKEEKQKKQVQIQNQNKKESNQKFVDLDGDGFNDNAPDHDGDGIPNGLDPDWQKQQNKFVDLDGDGINDNSFQEQTGERKRLYGPGTNTQQQKGSHQVMTPEQKQQQKGKKGKN